ncbi:MAG TPA: alpha/beta hydrolase [Polyangia bacterium]|jgi:acetyl esterase/lipase|nr:alpha/beta hydrolase [Polyangia bacterium]
MYPLADDDREREKELRAQFAQFWSTATGDPRTVYDTFISATPLAEGVSSDERVETASARGWWVRPSLAEHDGVILYLHGGGYVAGSAKAYRGIASQLASRARRPVLVLDYPLAPEATVPAAPNVVMAAYDWLRANGSERIAFVGDSAGGGLTLVTLARLAHTSRPSGAIAGVVFSPWVDLAFTGASMKDGHIEDPLLSYENLQRGARMYLGGADSRDPLASPLFGDLSGLPPLLIQVGSDERLLDDARQYAERAAGAGSPVRLEVWQGMHHVFQVDVAHLRTSGVALDRAAAFLSEAFKKGELS